MLKKLAGRFVGMKIKTNFRFSPFMPELGMDGDFLLTY